MINNVLVGNKTASLMRLSICNDPICVESLPNSFWYIQKVISES